MPNPGPCISPAKTGRVGTPSIKQDTISVPPLTEWIKAFEFSFLFINLKVSGLRGEPVEIKHSIFLSLFFIVPL